MKSRLNAKALKMLHVKNAGALQSPGKVLFKPRSEIPVAA